MGIRHRLPAGDDGFARSVRQRFGGHLPGAHRHHLAGDVGRECCCEFAGIGVGGEDQRAAADFALRRRDDPAVVLALESRGRRARKDAPAAVEHGARKPARQRQRIDVAAGPVPEAAEPGIGAEHRRRLARATAARRGRRPWTIAARGARRSPCGRANAPAVSSRPAPARPGSGSGARRRTAWRRSRAAAPQSARRWRGAWPRCLPGRAASASGSPGRCCGPSRPSRARRLRRWRRRRRPRADAARWRAR